MGWCARWWNENPGQLHADADADPNPESCGCRKPGGWRARSMIGKRCGELLGVHCSFYARFDGMVLVWGWSRHSNCAAVLGVLSHRDGSWLRFDVRVYSPARSGMFGSKE